MSNMNVVLPCEVVNNENFHRLWPCIIESLSSCDFISIDLEMSGLGNKDIYANQIDERYKAIKEVASTRSVLSMGIACFKISFKDGYFNASHSLKNEHLQAVLEQIKDCLDEGDELTVNLNHKSEVDEDYHVSARVFNFLTLCHSEFVMEARSMKFLAQQSFDFNELSLKGIPYYSGSISGLLDTTKPSIRRLFAVICLLKLPVVFHNGFLDIAFIYQNFYANLPKNVNTFSADLHQLFPCLYDTKMISVMSENYSYLEYLFNYSLRKSYYQQLKKVPSLKIQFRDLVDLQDVKYVDLSPKILQIPSEITCPNYSKAGWCDKSGNCEMSHNIDLILDEELKSKKSKNAKSLLNLLKSIHESNSRMDASGENEVERARSGKGGTHDSGIDAFMTGYYFLSVLFTNPPPRSCDFKKLCDKVTKFKDKIFLTGKPMAFNIMKSSFIDHSKTHIKLYEMIRDKVDLT